MNLNNKSHISEIHKTEKNLREKWGKADTLTLNPCIFLPIDNIVHPIL